MSGSAAMLQVIWKLYLAKCTALSLKEVLSLTTLEYLVPFQNKITQSVTLAKWLLEFLGIPRIFLGIYS